MTATAAVAVRRALLSVSDKTSLIELARALIELQVELISTGGTAAALRAHGLPVRDVAELTGFPEMMDGRLKTLHPRVHGGLLGRVEQDHEAMAAHGILPIDLLVVNLYPFAATVARSAVTFDEAIENIDIGGPAMLRAAAKNHQRVAVLTDPVDYPALIAALRGGGSDLALRRTLAAKAFTHCARYDGLIGQWLSARVDPLAAPAPWPSVLQPAFDLAMPLRYGENPHQRGALYREPGLGSGQIAGARLLQGKELSYNNIADADAALECVKLFTEAPACVIVKHANPCGVAVAADLLAAYDAAYAGDPLSAFGGIIACNRPLDLATAQAILRRQFVEVVVAPEIEPAALLAFAAKPNVRVLACGAWPLATTAVTATLDCKRIHGGLLVQDRDHDCLSDADLRVVSQRQPDAGEMIDLRFAWRVAMMVKSNAIVYARGQRSIGIGAGQMSRVISAKIAAMKAAEAGLEVAGAVLASDAFFPFRDGIDAAAEAGIRAVIQPGGSIRDAEVIAAADQHHLAMVFTGVRHFRH
ncbi:MAG: bifunctional phosphoribosylaminoimidazolecarboxamide formyltransferase/inosine monophosphate cyclohydrolase [Lysobacterales bacterium CG02_land_8_20_14_3_00_62_12]|nr:MAG: bifunctional phosphoribosylaminoimidazolecarboxamide formyltransferase/inosine monophosphate cyclohydrolase [Xanthomonadales bacterium CG02_land_8_20_14_3_00_62_12]